MSDLSEFFDAYESGQIGAVDLYEQLPPEMRKSVDEMLKGKEEEKKDDDDSQKDEIRDVLFEGKEDLDKPGPSQATAAYSVAGGSERRGPVDTSTPPYAASLSASLKAKENQTASRYGIETVRKSFVGHSCTHCQRLHKSVGKVCDECRKSMNSTVWHSGSHLE